MSTRELPSWNDGAARAAILDFVARAADEVPEPERVAVFDNDGTLWCERPAYTQALFLQAALSERAARDPELAAQPVVAALLAGDLEGAMGHGLGAFGQALLGTHEGLTPDAFTAATATWFTSSRHPRFGVGFDQLAYVPMTELMGLLRDHGFRVFIVTGGGVEFVRAVSERIYGVTPDDVVGSAVEVDVQRRDGRVEVVRTARLRGSVNEGPPKVANIQAHIGQRPILAVGNSAGDSDMLAYATTGDRAGLAVVLDHDDDEREYTYAGKAMTDPAAPAIEETAAAQGWTVVSMRDDWARVFAG